MALTAGTTLTAADFNNLKNRIDTECRRRNGTGSVASLPDNYAYKYVSETAPLKNREAILEHYTKIVNQISYIKTLSDKNLPNYKRIDSNALSKVSSEITTLENFKKGTSDDFAGKTGCKSSCTGLCFNECTGTCTGTCTETCVEGCVVNCAASCVGGCTGCTGCGHTCGFDCTITTTGSCGQCDGTCYGTCFQSCAGLNRTN